MGRVCGLDAVRFVCALWVFAGHGAALALWNPFAEGSLPHLLLRGVYGNVWTGAAAVIVFFVISGFCIHYPFAGSERSPRLGEFYTRRFIRILLPVGVAIPLSHLVGIQLTLFQDSILWSLLAELVYYAVYPAVRWIQLRQGKWSGLLAISFVLALGVAATNPLAGNYPAFGWQFNWLLGLPCWLAGCALAESIRTRPAREVSAPSIWLWRGAVFGAAWSCSVLRYHSPLGYPWTLNFFALLVACWLEREIHFRRTVAPPRWLERAGSWSYSLYLVHVPAGAWFSALVGTWPGGGVVRWAAMMGFVLAACYVFYVLVERPSHHLAKLAARKIATAAPAVAALKQPEV